MKTAVAKQDYVFKKPGWIYLPVNTMGIVSGNYKDDLKHKKMDTVQINMGTFTKLEQFYYESKGNKWFQYFAIFNRIALAAGFIISGLVKIKGERFASGLSVNNPMGSLLRSLAPYGLLLYVYWSCSGNDSHFFPNSENSTSWRNYQFSYYP